MREPARERVAVDVPWKTLLKILAAAALVWVWLQIWQVFLVVVVAVVLAVALDPLVRWAGRHGVGRATASTVVVFALAALVVGFVFLTYTTLADEAKTLGTQMADAERQVLQRLPESLRERAQSSGGTDVQSYLGPLATRVGRAAIGSVAMFVLALVLTVYCLIEGRRTYAWLRAFASKPNRARLDQTVTEGKEIIASYVAGNVATSVITAVCTLVVLLALKVPAAFLLALIAGLFDFVPVVGFFLSVVPAVVLALTVSPMTALLVVAFFFLYQTIENYYISPRVYGGRLDLSNLAVILAFVVGGELAGVVGALVALPLAAMYPTIERIWLRDRLGDDVVGEHHRIERKSA